MWDAADEGFKLYQTGARNFLFMNVPPMDRAPGGASSLAESIPDWNSRLKGMAMNLSSTYSDVSVFTFETDVLFNLILDNPSSIKETAQITNTTGSCPAYGKDVSAPDQSDPSCSAPYNQYFWQDGLHPMFTVHQAIAAQVAEGLRG